MSGGRSGLKLPKQNCREPKYAIVLNQNNALKYLSEDSLMEIRNSWNSMTSKGYGEANYNQANGIIQALINYGLPNKAIKGVLVQIGNNRIDRIRKNPVRTKISKKPYNAFSEDDIQRIKIFLMRLDKEDGLPCAHRHPRQYLVKEGATKISCWKIYAMVMKSNNFRFSSYDRFIQYWDYFSPGLRTTRLKSDACDSCVRIDIALTDPSTSAEMKCDLLLEKSMHLSAARNQRRAMNSAIKHAVLSWADFEISDEQIFVQDIIEEENNENICKDIEVTDTNESKFYNIVVQCEDFGQSIAVPHYGHIQPGSDF